MPARPRANTAASDSDNESTAAPSLRAPSVLKGKGRDQAGPLQRGSAWYASGFVAVHVFL